MRHQMLKQIERCCIKPLQIIEEQRERMLFSREHAEEASENHLEAVLRVLRRRSVTDGCLPITSSSSGTRLTMS